MANATANTLDPPAHFPPVDCQPWCTSHADSTADSTPEDRRPDPNAQLCLNTVTAGGFGEFLMSHSADDGTMINLYSTKLELAKHEAKQFAYAILSALA